MVSLKKRNDEAFSKCRICESTKEVNEYGYCRKCVQDRARRLIEAHSSEPLKSIISPAIDLSKRTVPSTPEASQNIHGTASAAPFGSKMSASNSKESQEVADHDIVSDWEKERKQRIAERDRIETRRIEESRDKEIATFKSNIASVKVLRDIDNTVEIDIKYHRPISKAELLKKTQKRQMTSLKSSLH